MYEILIIYFAPDILHSFSEIFYKNCINCVNYFTVLHVNISHLRHSKIFTSIRTHSFSVYKTDESNTNYILYTHSCHCGKKTNTGRTGFLNCGNRECRLMIG